MKNFFFLILIFLISCAPQKDVTKSEEDNSFAKYEKTFDPSVYDDEIKLEEKQRENIEVKPKEKVEPEIINGFRIQILMTKEIAEANSVKNELSTLFPDYGIYMIFESPYYKIRMGDFSDRESANRVLPYVVDKGYKSAWIVPDKVLKK